ncbi:MAG: ATP synthase subunit I [Pseudomonadota bacterium]|nr:ATP synthase subunit I [Pseudomonadota bacterium]
MNVSVILAMICAGAIIGVLYFGGLWLTLNKLTRAKSWGLWLGVSFMMRMTMAMAGFWFLGAGDWRRILALATGFTIVRFLSVKRIRPEPLQTS